MNLSSCSVAELDGAEPLLYAGGGYGIADALQDDKGVSAAAAAGGFFLSKFNQKRRNELVQQEIQDARSDGKQKVMLELLDQKYAAQGPAGGGNLHEVSVPFEGYTTSDGVELEPHEKIILTR